MPLDKASLDTLIGRRLSLPGHFDGSVTIEAARPLGSGVEICVRLSGGDLEEGVLSGEEAVALLDVQPGEDKPEKPR